MSRTTREIDWRVKAIDKRLALNFKFQASIHGVDMKYLPQEEPKPVELKGMDKHKERALKEIRERHGGK